MKRVSILVILISLAAVLHAESAEEILNRAAGQIGTPYRTGGTAPGGFDCSGFVTWLFRPAVPALPRLSRDQARFGESVEGGDWLPGDLLFYATGRETGRINHVAVYYGGGRIIHSISDGPETGVVVSPADARYWSRRYVAARRVLPAAAAGAPQTAPEKASGPVSPAAEPAVPAADRATDQSPAESPWDEFEGFLRGDFEAWKAADEEAFEAYKRENG